MGERVFQVEAYHKQRLKHRGDTGWVEEMFTWGFVVAVVPLLSRVWFFVTTWAVACQAPFIYGISQASIVDWGAISKPGNLPNPGFKPMSLLWQEVFSLFLFNHWATREALTWGSVQFSHSVMSDSLWPHGLQHVSLPWPSPSPRAGSNSSS